MANQDPSSPTGVAAVELTEEQLKEYKEAFSLFDDNGDNSISNDELMTVMRTLGYNPTVDEVIGMIKDVDKNNNGKIEFDEFIMLMERKIKDTFESEELIRAAFGVIDTDGEGYITKSKLRRIIQDLGQDLTEQEMDEMIEEADMEGDGRVNYEALIGLISEDNRTLMDAYTQRVVREEKIAAEPPRRRRRPPPPEPDPEPSDDETDQRNKYGIRVRRKPRKTLPMSRTTMERIKRRELGLDDTLPYNDSARLIKHRKVVRRSQQRNSEPPSWSTDSRMDYSQDIDQQLLGRDRNTTVSPRQRQPLVPRRPQPIKYVERRTLDTLDHSNSSTANSTDATPLIANMKTIGSVNKNNVLKNKKTMQSIQPRPESSDEWSVFEQKTLSWKEKKKLGYADRYNSTRNILQYAILKAAFVNAIDEIKENEKNTKGNISNRSKIRIPSSRLTNADKTQLQGDYVKLLASPTPTQTPRSHRQPNSQREKPRNFESMESYVHHFRKIVGSSRQPSSNYDNGKTPSYYEAETVVTPEPKRYKPVRKKVNVLTRESLDIYRPSGFY